MHFEIEWAECCDATIVYLGDVGKPNGKLSHAGPLDRRPGSRATSVLRPQFEADRKHSKKGIIRDAAVHKAVCDDIVAFAEELGCTEIKVFPSSIAGGDGNTEFFLGARRG